MYPGLMIVAFLPNHCCRNPQTFFPVQLCAEPPQIDFACAPEWNSTSRCMLSRAQTAPLRLSSPALTIGILLEEAGQTDDGLSPDELMQISRAAQPHLEALLIAWDQCYPKSPPNPTVCIFALAFRPGHVFVVAHVPYPADSECNYQSIVVDRIPFPFYIPGTEDHEGLLARPRLAISLLTIQNHTSRAASLCQDVVWPAKIVDRELALVHDCTGIITPSPSEHQNPDTKFWGCRLTRRTLEQASEPVYGSGNAPPRCRRTRDTRRPPMVLAPPNFAHQFDRIPIRDTDDDVRYRQPGSQW
ncbi:hypothetical protein B0H13DRAFT_1881944 [Mycena leptocephala]|nr:hypothetical protein B0H13DRAFT_1881944 [Mycena leptocephala]